METVTLNPDTDVVHLLQITDPHLFADAQGELLGIRTADSLAAVVAAIRQQDEPFDLVLATGDIAQDHSAGAYRRFAEAVQPLGRPLYWLPGNHDAAPLMKVKLAKGGCEPARQLLLPHWQILLLDTQVEGTPHGWLYPEQLQFLAQALGDWPEKHALICLHHHSFPVGSDWLDQHDLKNANELMDLLAHHPQVRGVLCGHVHQEYDALHQGVRFLATPSTCIQFMPLSRDFSLDVAGPGWRYLQLHPDGRLATQVWRLPAGSFIPDAQATGY